MHSQKRRRPTVVSLKGDFKVSLKVMSSFGGQKSKNQLAQISSYFVNSAITSNSRQDLTELALTYKDTPVISPSKAFGYHGA